MERLKHPQFPGRFLTFLFAFVALGLLFFAASLYADGQGQDVLSGRLILLFMATIALGVLGAWYRLAHVQCPRCHEMIKTVKDEKLDLWVANCQTCQVSWSLGVGTNSDS